MGYIVRRSRFVKMSHSPPPAPRIFLGVGANLAPAGFPGPREGCMAAVESLEEDGVGVVAVSPWYRTAPVPASDQPWYRNAVVEVETGLAPQELMDVLHERETRFGRVRRQRNESRVLDLDIIDYRGQVQEGPPTLPHPRMHRRGFVLRPLLDLAPDWRHPATGASIAELVAAVDPSEEIEPDGGGQG